MMTFRDAIAYALGIGSFLTAASSCATPVATDRAIAEGAPAGWAAPLLRDRSGPYEVEVLIDGAPAATFSQPGGTYVLGQLGARYTLRVSNHSGQRIEAVVSVDGRDVIDGRPADFRSKRGYMIPAFGQIEIEGWRISHAEAATFRFSSVPNSYAGRTGSAREVGAIGVAVFPERYTPPPPRYPQYPYYYPHRPYDAPSDRDGADEQAAPSGQDAPPSASAPAPAPSKGGAATAEAEAPRGRAEGKASPLRPGLGTEYGEAVSSPIFEVPFVRANPSHPSAVLGLRYNDRQGLLAMGIDVDGPDWATYGQDGMRDEDLRQTADPFPAAHRFAAPPPGWRDGWRMR
jgi:hypothetical protein